MNQKALFLPVLILAACAAGCDDFAIDMGGARVEAPFHFSYNVHPGGRLELESFNGSIEVRGWDQNKVDVDGVKWANSAALRDAIRIDTNDTPGSVTIRAVRPPEHHGSMGAKFVVRVPNNFVLDRIVTSNGSVRVEDINGSVRVRSSNGSLNFSHLNGPVNANTSNSSISVAGLTGNAVLETNNGHIGADHVNGQVDATSSNGSIELNFESSPKDNIHASTSNSSITVHMPSSSAARLRASTSNSSIETDFDVSSQSPATKTHLEGAINGGGPLVDLSTSNGSIKVLKP